MFNYTLFAKQKTLFILLIIGIIFLINNQIGLGFIIVEC